MSCNCGWESEVVMGCGMSISRPDVIAAATHVRVICAKFECMYGSNMSEFGHGWVVIIWRAWSICGPHSLE